MTEMRRGILIAISIAAVPAALLAYGPTGHEIVSGIADKLVVNTPAGEKIYTLTDGITLERASVIADEIKAWDKNGVDDPNAFPHYPEHAKIDKQLRDFWRGNPPTQDSKSHAPSHHWFHYTDVPILNLEKYSDGKTGRSQWDIVHMISYCVDVLRGEIPEDNPRKITRPVAVILLAHYVGDIHQPLHVGAEYFNQAGQAVDPDRNQPGIEDEGGNTFMLRLTRGTPEGMAHRGLKLHGFWDYDAVMANLPPLSPTLSKEERHQKTEQAKRKLMDRLTKEQPTNWRAPANIALKTMENSGPTKFCRSRARRMNASSSSMSMRLSIRTATSWLATREKRMHPTASGMPIGRPKLFAKNYTRPAGVSLICFSKR